MYLQLLILLTVLQTLNQPAKGQDCLTTHNYLRSLHGAPPLIYDEVLEKYASRRAEELASTDVFEHPKNGLFAENLVALDPGGFLDCRLTVWLWYNEIWLYKYKSPVFTLGTGHFTMVVWRDARKLGCAFAQSPKTYRIYGVCVYYPWGNVLGKFEENVAHPLYRKISE